MVAGGNTTYTCKQCGRKFIGWLSAKRLYCGTECGNANASKRAKRHGESYTRLHSIWCHMKTRCYCETSVAFDYYGGRGIVMCGEWRNSYEAFRDWSLANGYDDTLEIDRKDPNGNYEPDNCRWATRVQQMRNTRKRKNAKTSKFKGVSWCANANRWRVQINRGTKSAHLCLCTTELTAAFAYDDAAEKLFGQHAHFNFPERIRIRQREKSESVDLQTKGCQSLGAIEKGVEPGTVSSGPGGSTFVGSA